MPHTPPESELKAILDDLRRHLDWQAADGHTTVPANPRAPSMPPHPGPGAGIAPGGGARPPRKERAEAPLQSELLPLAPLPGAASASGPGGSLTAPAQRRTLEEIRAELGDCPRCKLCSGRKNIVFGVGSPNAELVFVGEGPGADEDEQGIPFVGKAGQLLTKMIEAMGFARDQVYICNVVKCRPPNNRNPEPDEIDACEPFLRAQLGAIQPKAIVALGKFAAQTLLRDDTPISRLRGSWREYCGVPLMPTFHPAYLLRNPAEKKNAWLDLRQVMKLFGKTAAGRV